MLAAHLAQISFSFTLHGPSDLFDAKHWRLDEKIKAARFVSCISYFARSQAMMYVAPEHWEKLHIIHCGVEPERYGPPTWDDENVELTFVGRLAPVKGLRFLLPAFEEALKTQPNLRLKIIGDGPERAALEAQAAPLKDAVRFTGPLSQADVAAELAKTDVLVLPSFAEGVPVVLMEAMASGKPVIATQVAGVSELVKSGENGLVIPPGHSAALKDAILALAADPEGRRRMGQAGRETVEAGFNIQKEASRLAALLEG